MIDYLKKSLRIFLLTSLTILLLVTCLFAWLQSKWAKHAIQERVTQALKDSGICATFNMLDGRPPFLWTFNSVTFTDNQGQSVSLQGVKCRLAFFPLLKGELYFNTLSIEEATLKGAWQRPGQKIDWQQIAKQWDAFALPWNLSLARIRIDRLSFQEDPHPISCEGTFVLENHGAHKEIACQLFATEEKHPFFQLGLELNRATNKIAFSMQASDFSLPYLCLKEMEIHLNGAWHTWHALIDEQPVTGPPLLGHLHGTGIDTMWQQEWKSRVEFQIKDHNTLKIIDGVCKSNLFHVKGKGVLTKKLEHSALLCAFSFPDLSLLPISKSFPLHGVMRGKVQYHAGSMRCQLDLCDLAICELPTLTHIKGWVNGSIQNAQWVGNAHFLNQASTTPSLEGQCRFSWIPKKLFSCQDLCVQFLDAKATGEASWNFNNKLLTGSLEASIPHLEYFRKDIVEGSCALHWHAREEEALQQMTLALEGEQMRYRDFFLRKIKAQGECVYGLEEISGALTFDMHHFSSPYGHIEYCAFHTKGEEEEWPFSIELLGTRKVKGALAQPVHCHLQGVASQGIDAFALELTECTGELASIPMQLNHPVLCEFTPHSFTCSELSFNFGAGAAYLCCDISTHKTLGQWEIVHMPLEIFNTISPFMQLHGTVSTTGYTDIGNHYSEGAANLLIQGGKYKGVLLAHLRHDTLQIQSNLRTQDEQFLDWAATCHVMHDFYPLSFRIDPHRPISSELICEGRIEELFEWMNIGSNHLTGWLSSRLFLSHSMNAPSLQGHIDWSHGTYENYLTGLTLRNIEARLAARHNRLDLLLFKAQDLEKGVCTAKGALHLDPRAAFPYGLTAEVNHLHALHFGMIDCRLTGPLEIKGTTACASAQGQLVVDSASIELTESLPYEVPSLPVTFQNFPSSLLAPTITYHPPFPLHIDLTFIANDKVYVSGQGLKAELQGKVHLTGTNTHVNGTGSLQLLKGEYQFSGKIFKLTEGEIIFTHTPTSSAYLHLNGVLELPNVTITAILRGPLTHPQLTFQSNPQMSTSALLALILFNKNIADISHPEALQLASTLMSLSGGAGPNVLETIRKTIGVDRLNLVSASPGSDAVAVQIGKYLMRGVMITLSQSATSSQVIVEVELPQGFVFQAETQEEQEGKFSLKWTKSY